MVIGHVIYGNITIKGNPTVVEELYDEDIFYLGHVQCSTLTAF